MRTLLRWLVVTLGIAALVRWLRHRGQAPAQTGAKALDDPAAELRRKLAAARAVEQEAPAHGPAPEPEASLDERRAEVHAQGQAALADMASSDEG